MSNQKNERVEAAFEAARDLARILSNDMVTTMILEERGELSAELAEKREEIRISMEQLIRKSVRIAIALQDSE